MPPQVQLYKSATQRQFNRYSTAGLKIVLSFVWHHQNDGYLFVNHFVKANKMVLKFNRPAISPVALVFAAALHPVVLYLVLTTFLLHQTSRL